jgi:hypothetical protein
MVEGAGSSSSSKALGDSGSTDTNLLLWQAFYSILLVTTRYQLPKVEVLSDFGPLFSLSLPPH